MTIGEKIKFYRIQSGMKQQQLATAIHVSNKAISHYELNKREPSIDVLKKLAEILQVDVSCFIDDKPHFHILVIDETTMTSLSFRDTLKRHFSTHSHSRITLTSDTDEAYRYIKENSADLIFIKGSFKKMDSFALTKHFLSHPLCPHVFLYTSLGSKKHEEEFLAIGGSGIINPLIERHMMPKISSALGLI